MNRKLNFILTESSSQTCILSFCLIYHSGGTLSHQPNAKTAPLDWWFCLYTYTPREQGRVDQNERYLIEATSATPSSFLPTLRGFLLGCEHRSAGRQLIGKVKVQVLLSAAGNGQATNCSARRWPEKRSDKNYFQRREQQSHSCAKSWKNDAFVCDTPKPVA